MSPRKIHWYGLLALMACALASPPAMGGWFSEIDQDQKVTLGSILQDPRAYLDRDVRIEVVFKEMGDTYNPYYTRFDRDSFVNLRAWPIDAKLYERRDFARPYPHFYVQRDEIRGAWEDFKEMDAVTPLEVTCRVREIFRGVPYIEVLDFDEISSGQDLDDVRAMVRGNALANAGRYEEAIEYYEEAADKRLHPDLVADIYRRLGDAQYQVGRYSHSVQAYKVAAKFAPDNSVIAQGLQAAEEMDDLTSKEREGYDPQHRPAYFETRTDDGYTNDIDLIIPLFEDVQDVTAEVARERERSTLVAIRARDGGTLATPLGEQPVDQAEVIEMVEQPEVAEEESVDVVEIEETEAVEEPMDAEETEVIEEEPVEAQPTTEPEVVEELPVEEMPIEVTEPVEEIEVVEEQPIEAAAPGDETAEETEVEVVEETVEDDVEETDVEVVEETVEDGAEEAGEEVSESSTDEDVEVATPADEATEVVADETESGDVCEPDEVVVSDGTVGVIPFLPVPLPGDGTPVEPGMTETESVESAEVAEQTAGETVDASVDETMEEAMDEGMDEGMDGVEAAVGAEQAEETVEDVPLPRLPFFGCDEVTEDDLRAIIHEIALAPEE